MARKRKVNRPRESSASGAAKTPGVGTKARKTTHSMPEDATETLAGLDVRRATELVLELMAIPGASGDEGDVADAIERELLAAGAKPSMIRRDRVNRRTPIKGNTGNLILKLPGTRRGPRRMFSAHMDTVPICVGCRPKVRKRIVRSSDPQTGLGADDRAGVATILTAAIELLSRRLPHPPLTFCWFVQEEIGLHGSRLVSPKALGDPQLAFNWDGGAAGKLTVGATGGCRIAIEVTGVASHAGVAPECGVSAIEIASLAIADLKQKGWLGLVERGKRRGTSNVGVFRAGDATNVVTDRAVLRAEARSHNSVFRERIVTEIEKAFERAARQVKNVEGARGSIRFTPRTDYESFLLSPDEPCVVAADAAVRAVRSESTHAVANGGVDANWTTRHGIPTVTLGCGQMNPHMVTEAPRSGWLRRCLSHCPVVGNGLSWSKLIGRRGDRMELDDDLCICFHVTKRKVVNYLRVERPQRAGQLADCFGAGTGCGWCRPFLRKLFAEAAAAGTVPADLPSADDYAQRRQKYLDDGKQHSDEPSWRSSPPYQHLCWPWRALER